MTYPQNVPSPSPKLTPFGQRNQIVLAAQMLALAKQERQRKGTPPTRKDSRTVGLAPRILELLETNGPTRLADIPRALGCHLTSIQYHTLRMVDDGTIIRQTDGRRFVTFSLAA